MTALSSSCFRCCLHSELFRTPFRCLDADSIVCFLFQTLSALQSSCFRPCQDYLHFSPCVYCALPFSDRPGVDVVVTDYTCTNSIVDKARQLGVPVVASEWVIQCLINNALLKHDGHPMYAHDYYKEAAKSRHGSGQQQAVH